MKIYQQHILHDDILLFDGLARSGRAAVAVFLSDIARVEYAQILNHIDQIPVLWHLGSLEHSAAVSFLRMSIDAATYERSVGRHLNTRMSDNYSVRKSLQAGKIMGRQYGPEHMDAVKIFQDERRISSFITHHTLPLADLWLEAFPKARFLLTVRHPLDVLEDWLQRGWGDRWGVDPLSFWPVQDIDGEPVPWFYANGTVDSSAEYTGMTSVSRVALAVVNIMEMNNQKASELEREGHHCINTVCFENFVRYPEREGNRIAQWLDSEMRADYPIAMAKIYVPREWSLGGYDKRLEPYQKKLNPQLFERFKSLCNEYEEKWFG